MASLIPTSPPSKRQKITEDGGYSSSNPVSAHNTASNTGAYNSEADSGDELFAGFIPDTPAKYETQPTQILDRSANNLSSRLSTPPETPQNDVQVPASSPLTGKDTAPIKPAQQNGVAPQKRSLAMSMAPAGTTFKPPHGIIAKPASTYITIDDDEPQVIDSDSSEDELHAKADIKPSTFKPKSAQSSFNSPPPQTANNGNAKFHSIVSNAAYKGPGVATPSSLYGGQGRDFAASTSSMSRVSDSIAMGRGSTTKSVPQRRPERAQPIQDISIESLNDHVLREKVTRLRAAFPMHTVLTCRNALIHSRGNVDDAASILAGESQSMPDSDEIESPQAPKIQQAPLRKLEPQMKRTIDAPLASLKDRYSSTQALAPKLSAVTPPPKKKKLVQGRRNPSSPTIPAVSSPLKPQPSPVISLDEYDSDSGVASATEEEDPELEDRVLKFLNTCTLEDLIELTSTTKIYAQLMIDARPFKSCDAARCVENPTKTKGGKRSTRAPIGEKIVDTAINMFTGYEAIDALVSKCKDLGKPLAETMSTWGFDVFGARTGELEMTSFEDENASQRDSGIGSPSSGTGDGDDDVKVISSTRKKNVNFIKQPAMMSEDVALKDYQVVGLNWLALMYRQKLSGILADEMGLGKTCQVIALLSHLVETGHPGPHLVICPGSTLENWLREIPRFSPSLAVDVYYGMLKALLEWDCGLIILGPQKERAEMAESILERRAEINVVVTTYDLAARPEDNKFMRRLKPDVSCLLSLKSSCSLF